MNHEFPPLGGDVALKLYAEGTVIVGALEPAVDLAALKDESASFCKGHDLVEGII